MERSEVRFQVSNPTSPQISNNDPNRNNFFNDQSAEMYQVSSPEPGYQQQSTMYSQEQYQNEQMMYLQDDPRIFQSGNQNGTVQWSNVQGQGQGQGQGQTMYIQQQHPQQLQQQRQFIPQISQQQRQFTQPQQQQMQQQPMQQQQQPQQQQPQQQQPQQQHGPVQSQGRQPGQEYLRQFHFLYPHNRDPNEKLPEQPHIQEQEHLKNLHLHQGSVCQFPTKIRNPEERYPEQPHIGQVEELSNLHLHQGSVCQFPSKIRNPEEKLPEQSHMNEMEGLANLHLKQGSVVQFPSKLQSTKFDYFHPPETPMKELLPVAQIQQDHCLPSQARKQQTYITHPSALPAKLMVRGGTATPEGTESPAQWPNEEDQSGRNSGQKNFIWPPPRREYYGSCQELPPPGPENIAGTSWKISQPGERLSGLRSYAPSRRQYNWPPNGRQPLRKQGSFPESGKSRSLLELDEVITARPPGSVASYRPPPWSQFFKPGYYNQG